MRTPAQPSADIALRPVEDVAVRRRLVELVRSATSMLQDGEYDIVLLAARRMACLYTLMRTVSDLEAPDDGMILSDRFLELSAATQRESWNVRRALIVDDSVNSGATLRNRVDRLRQLGVEEVDVAAAVNGPQPPDPEIAELFIDPPPLQRTLREVHRQSRQFAALFAHHRVPYFTDFPVSEEVADLPLSDFDELLNHREWQTVDVSSAAVHPTDRTYALLPRQPVLDRLAGHDSWLSDKLELAKIRLFVSHGPTAVSLRVVPITSFRPLKLDSVDEWLESEGLLEEPRSHSDDLRRQAVGLLVFRACMDLMRAFTDSTGVEIRTDERILEIMLGAEVRDRLAHFPVDGQLPSPAKPRPLEAEGFLWNSVETDTERERIVLGDNVVRGMYAEVAKAAMVSDDRDSAEDRDGRGLNFDHFAAHGSNVATVSLAIDVLNDLGTAVPKHRINRTTGVVERAFRPGETSYLDYDKLPVGRLGGRLARIADTMLVDPDRDVDDPERYRRAEPALDERPEPTSETLADD